MFPKQTGYRTKRARAKAAYRTARPAVREAAYTRDSGRCVFPDCRRLVLLKTDDPYSVANAHELLSRARGGSPTALTNVVTVCSDCHQAMHTPVGGKTARIDGTTLGALGPLRFFRKQCRIWVEIKE